jgi:hypothetical protein
MKNPQLMSEEASFWMFLPETSLFPNEGTGAIILRQPVRLSTSMSIKKRKVVFIN